MSSGEPASSNNTESSSADYFESDRNIRILSRRNERTGEPDPDFDEAFRNLDKYMKMAFDMAYEALDVQEVPVGCVFVYKNEVIARGRNRVNETCNGTLHAEIVALRNTEIYCQERNLDPREVMKEISLYVNLEPCQMCAAAMQLLNVPRIFFGACNDRFGGVVTVGNLYDYMENPATMDLVSGLGWKRTVFLLQAFYSQTNPKAPEHKRLVKSEEKRKEIMKTLNEEFRR